MARDCKPEKPARTRPGDDRMAAREGRRARALRENLKRRKAQARGSRGPRPASDSPDHA
jgi:hypothetical protein